ncbi:MAG: response regulator [Candidatus Brocadiales bacterium]
MSEVRSCMGEKILVMDSDKDSQERTKSILNKAGYEAMTVEDRFSGLQALREVGGFSAVLVQEEADGTNGLDMLQDIKAISPEMPVVVSAASWTPQALQCCTEVGAFFCMDKKTEDELLVKVLGKAVEEYKLSSKL